MWNDNVHFSGFDFWTPRLGRCCTAANSPRKRRAVPTCFEMLQLCNRGWKCYFKHSYQQSLLQEIICHKRGYDIWFHLEDKPWVDMHGETRLSGCPWKEWPIWMKKCTPGHVLLGIFNFILQPVWSAMKNIVEKG